MYPDKQLVILYHCSYSPINIRNKKQWWPSVHCASGLCSILKTFKLLRHFCYLISGQMLSWLLSSGILSLLLLSGLLSYRLLSFEQLLSVLLLKDYCCLATFIWTTGIWTWVILNTVHACLQSSWDFWKVGGNVKGLGAWVPSHQFCLYWDISIIFMQVCKQTCVIWRGPFGNL